MTTIKSRKEKTVFMMSIPIFVELFMQFLVGNVDQIMLSNISEDAVAAIVNANQLINLVMIISTFLANAVMVRFTHAIGREENEMYEKAFFSGHIMMFVYTAVVMALFVFAGRELLLLFKARNSIIDDASAYLFVVSFSVIPFGIYCINTAALRSKGMLTDVMLISIFMNLLNIVGNAILINGWFGAPAMGVVGAGISTMISKIIGSLLVFIRLAKAGFVKFKFGYFSKFPKVTTKRLLHLAVPASIESFSYNMSQMVILSFINVFGNTDVATKGYCAIIANFAFLYSIAMAQSTQILVGYMIGRGDLEPIKKRVLKSSLICIVCSMSVMTLMYFSSDVIFSFFSASEEIKQLGKTILFVEIILEFGRSVNIMMSRMLTSLGDTMFLMKMGCSGHWLLATLFSYILGVHFGLGLLGVWIAMTMDENARGIAYLIRFSVKKWNSETINKKKPKHA